MDDEEIDVELEISKKKKAEASDCHNNGFG